MESLSKSQKRVLQYFHKYVPEKNAIEKLNNGQYLFESFI